MLSFPLTLAINENIRSTSTTKDRVHLQQSHLDFKKISASAISAPPTSSFSHWTGDSDDNDIFKHVRPLIEQQDKERALKLANANEEDGTSLVETGVGKVHAFCEICILIMQMKERGQPHLCAGLNPDYFVSVSVHIIILLSPSSLTDTQFDD